MTLGWVRLTATTRFPTNVVLLRQASWAEPVEPHELTFDLLDLTPESLQCFRRHSFMLPQKSDCIIMLSGVLGRGNYMRLWHSWFRCVQQLRGACARTTTFGWMTIVLAGMSIRTDLLGVTSWVRTLALKGDAYKRLLHTFHNRGIHIEKLTELWVKLALKIFRPVTFGPYRVCLADGLKVPKEGYKMPAVKKLHQESANNSKPPFIMGHSFQAISLLVSTFTGHIAAVPLVSRIHEGLVWSNRHKRTLLDKLATLFLGIAPIFKTPIILIADAYYASRKMIWPLLVHGHQLVTRVRSNAVGYMPAKQPTKPSRGRPRKYGKRMPIKDLLRRKFQTAVSPCVGEEGIEISYLCINLLWKPIGDLVRFVVVKHPKRGTIFLMSTDTTLGPLDILVLYGYRFQIEVGFRQAIHTLAAYQYHFWMMDMIPLTRQSGNQHLHRSSEEYRRLVRRKMDAYHRYVQLGCIAQGLLIYLAVTYYRTVWNECRTWFRTKIIANPPSELMVSHALRYSAFQFLHVSCPDRNIDKILRRYRDRRLLRHLRNSA